MRAWFVARRGSSHHSGCRKALAQRAQIASPTAPPSGGRLWPACAGSARSDGAGLAGLAPHGRRATAPRSTSCNRSRSPIASIRRGGSCRCARAPKERRECPAQPTCRCRDRKSAARPSSACRWARQSRARSRPCLALSVRSRRVCAQRTLGCGPIRLVTDSRPPTIACEDAERSRRCSPARRAKKTLFSVPPAVPAIRPATSQ